MQAALEIGRIFCQGTADGRGGNGSRPNGRRKPGQPRNVPV
jgi:hypothetical protein